MIVMVATAAAQDRKEDERLGQAAVVLKEILAIPEGIPQDLLDKSECVIVYPSVVKAAIGIGGSYGRGAMTCRTGNDYSGPWSPPAMYALEGASIGFQIGGAATDFVLLVMNDRRFSVIRDPGECSPECRSRARRCGPTEAPTRTCTASH
jgi:lipid-binding SYLF domain-containing protein